jgi:RHS repeat-associated protein
MSIHATSIGGIRGRLKTGLIGKFLLWLCMVSLLAPMTPAFAAATITTTTALATSGTSVAVGTAMNLTATVTAASGSGPTGTVTFKRGTATLGTATLSGTGLTRTATYAATFTTVATNSLTAVYAGDTDSKTSTSAAKSVSSTKATPTNALVSSLNPSTLGASVTFAATVVGYNPSGTVTFKDGSTTLGTGTLAGTGNTRTATYTTTSLSIASHSVTAVYAGDTLNNTVTSAALSQVVNAAGVATTTTVASSLNPSALGTSITFTASVTGTAPTGAVTFKDGATTLGTGTLSGTGNTRTATYTTTTLSVANHSITAVYAGDGANAGSTSVAVVQTVKAKPTVTLTSSVNPTNVGQTTVLVAKATGSNLNGVLKIMDGSTVLATWNVTGGVAGFTGQLTTPFATSGTHSLTATYSGDAVNADSASAVLAQVVNSTVPVVTLTSSINPANVYTQSPALQAKVTGTNLNGVLQILDGTTVLASWNVTGGFAGFTGTFTTNFSEPGNHSLTATYSGDPANANSASPILNQVINLAPTTTALASDTNPVDAGTPFTLTASITGSNYPSGTVTFRDGAVILGTGNVYSGTATLNTAIANAGSHNITATYDGDGLNATSASTALSVVVDKAVATVDFSSSPTPVFFGSPLTLMVTVNGSNPSGSVTFKDGATVIGTVALSGGVATFNTSALSVGSHNLTAEYAGDANNAGVTSSVLSQTIEPANIAPTVSVTSPINGARALAPANTFITATAADSDGSIAYVAFYNDGNLLATSYSAPYGFNLNNWPVGTYAFTAVATDDRGTSTTSSIVTFNVVATNVPPVVGLTSPANGANFETPVTINLTANATDSDGPIDQVAFYDGANLLGTSTTAPYSFTWVNAPAGNHNLTAVAIDDLGAITTSSVVAITVVANLPPTVSLTSPATGTNYATAPTNITISATAADSDGTVTQVAFYSGATLLSTSTTAPYSFSWTNVPGGSYAITAVATDNSGNTTTSSTVNVNVGTVVKITYLHNDFSGSPIAATDSAGAILWKENYRPYGDKRNVQAAGLNNRQWFHGKPVDEDTGLSYFGARYYDASLGRFMGVDPVTFQAGNYHSFNRYAYGSNNPYKYVDPDGRAVETAWDIVSFTISVAQFRSEPSFMNGVAVGLDGIAVAVPGLPGGVGIVRQMGRAADAKKAEAVATKVESGAAPGFDAARKAAFEKAGMTDASKVEFSKMDPKTGTVVEFKGQGGAKVGYDGPHASPGPHHDTQHISWQSAGKRDSGGTKRGNEPYSGPQHPSRPDRKDQ